MCWLYSMSNLLVIWHLETIYLGGNNERVVCERVWRFDQECATRRWVATGLSTDSRVVTCQNEAHVWSMQQDEELGQLDHYRTKSTNWPSLVTGDWNSRLILVASDSPMHPVLLKKMTIHISSHTLIQIPLYPRNVQSFQREFWERNPREKQD